MEKYILKMDGKIFFLKSKKMNKNNFIREFKVKKNSYLYDLYSRLYDYIMGDCINLYNEYENYYYDEYNNFKIFLIEHCNIPENIVDKFYTKNSYYKYKDVGNEQPISSILYNEEIRNIVIKFMGGYVYEN